MTLHRFFLPRGSVRDGSVTFPDEAARQLRSVLRLRSGDCVVVLDGSGLEYVTSLNVHGRHVTGAVEYERRNEAEPRREVILYQGVLKGAKLELVLQKCTEVGIAGFVPVITARSVAGEPSASKQRRYEAIVREAAEQCGRGRIPAVHQPLPWEAALRQASLDGSIVVPWEGEVNAAIRDLTLSPEGSVALFVGPEGGLTAEEVEAARSCNARVVSLGRRILRAETAAIVGATLLLDRLGELAPPASG